MRSEDITIQVPKDEKVLIFRSSILLKSDEMRGLYEDIMYQLRNGGVVVLPAYVDLVYPFPTSEPTDD